MNHRLGLALLAALAIVPCLIGGKYLLHISTMAATMSILALSMNLMLRIGQLSLAHGAFMAIGAYASALLTMRGGLPPMAALIAASALAALTAILLGLVILRIKGVFFVLVTYAFGQIVNLVLQEWTSVFGGNNGLYGIPKFSLFGKPFSDPVSHYVLALAFAAAAFAVVRAIFRSRAGIILDSLNEDEDLCRSLGSNALMWRTAVFGLSAALASVAGSLYAHELNFVSPPAFTFVRSVDALVMNIVGGAMSVFGPILGAIIIVPMPELLRDAREYQLLAYGAILLGCLLFLKNGLIGLFGRPNKAPA